MKNNFVNAIKRQLEEHNKIALLYPNRYSEIHKVACVNCPSVVNKKNGILDLETENIKKLNRTDQIKSRFVCGWRGSKLCKGYCDELNIKEADLKPC
jgi:hypothetical protein